MILYILIIWNILVMLLFGADKLKAKTGRRRIREATLLLTSFLFGSVGAMFGMVLFNHKTSKKKFRFLVPLAVMSNAAVILGLYFIPHLF